MVPVLRQFYGRQPSPPHDLFQFVVWEILSAQALPAKRDLAWNALRRLAALTPDAMFRAPAEELAAAVALAGPHRDERIDRLRTTVAEFKRRRGELESPALETSGLFGAARVLRLITHLSGDGRARAHLFALGYPILPVDDDISRLVGRLIGTVPAVAESRRPTSRETRRGRRAARKWLSRQLERDAATYQEAVIYLRHHAQHTCTALGPHCTVCPLVECLARP